MPTINHSRLIRKGEKEVMRKQDYLTFIFHHSRSDVQARTDELKEDLVSISTEIKEHQRNRDKKRFFALSLMAIGATLTISAVLLGLIIGFSTGDNKQDIINSIFSKYGLVAIITGVILVLSQSRANANYRQQNYDIFTRYGQIRQEIKVLRIADRFYEERDLDLEYCPRDAVREDSNGTLQLMHELKEETLAR